MTKSTKAHIALFVANAIYGFNYTAAKEVMPDYLQPFAFILMRVVGAAILFWVVSSSFKQEKIEKKDIPRFIACGFFGIALNQLMFFKGLNLTSPINAALIMPTTPIIVLVISMLLLKERLNKSKVLGILLGFGGALLLIFQQSNGELSMGSGIGNLFVFINATSYAIYLVVVKPLMQKYTPITIMKWLFLIGIIFVTPVSYNEIIEVDWNTITPIAWASIIYVIAGTTCCGYLLNIYGLKTLSPTVVSVYIYLQPLMAALFSILLGKDTITFYLIVSTILIFLGVYLINIKTR